MPDTVATEIKFIGKDEVSARIDDIVYKLKGLEAATKTDRMQKSMKDLQKPMRDLNGEGMSLSKMFSGTFLGMGMQQAVSRAIGQISDLSKSFLDAAREAEGMREELTLLVGSRADAVLASIRAEIGNMPVSLAAATAAYTKLRAGGIEPAMKDLKAMADLAGNLRGDASGNIEELAAIMSRLSTSTDLGANGLNRQLVALTQQGIPALDILREKLHLSADEMDDLGKAGVTGRDVVQALFEWMREQQGKTADGFDDLKQKLQNAWQEIQRQVMERGPFDALKDSLKSFLDYMNSAKGQMDIRGMLIEIGSTAAMVFKGMAVVMQPVVRTLEILKTWVSGAEFLISNDKLEQAQLRASNLRDAYNKLGLDLSPDAKKERANVKLQMEEAQASLKDLEARRDVTAAMFAKRDVSFFGTESESEKVLQEVVKNLDEARNKLALEASDKKPSTTKGEVTAGGLPTTTTYSTDELAGLEKMAEEYNKAIRKEWDEEIDLAIKSAEKNYKIRTDLTGNLNRLTMSEGDAKRKALDQELADLRVFAGESEKNAKLVADYRIARIAEIERAESESARRIRDQIEELNRQMTLPQAGRFEKERTDVQTEFLQRSRDLAEQRARGDITPDQEREVRTKLNEWRDYKFGEIGQRAGDDFSAGWGRGMQKTLDEMSTGFEQAQQMAQDTARAMSQGFGDFFFDTMQGKLKTFGDYVNSFMTSIQRSIANMLGEMMTRKILTSAVSGFGGMFGGVGAGYTGDVNVASGVSATAANGAVWQGGFTPLGPVQKFALGGVVNGPTLGLVGEGRYNEAIVPLPDGKSIPVVSKGGGQAVNIRVEVKNQSGQQVQARSEQPRFDGGEYVIGIVLDAVSRNRMGLRDAVRGL
ncbi:MAG: hypothetical protein LLG20_01920 [Acidobacteriales bacterium]|nr:hypothetical protein [Terriglobales bacterium]